MNLFRAVVGGVLLCVFTSLLLPVGADMVEVRYLEQQQKVEILVGGRPFTAYCFGPDFQRKPVFYPVISPGGVVVNREIPFGDDDSQRSQDHPHHQSLFFGYGDIDGEDFWTCRQGEKILHQSVLKTSSGTTGQLSILLEWLDSMGKALVSEVKRVTFGGSDNVHWMDHDITLTALGESRSFADTKEGMFAIRLADELREDEGSGRYINAYGWETADQIWGKRAPWVGLRGTIGGNDVTVAIFDHPISENHPSYWHARGYGLFSINPFGRKDFVKGAEPDNRRLEPHESFHFRHRVLVYDGKVSKQRLDLDYWEYVK